MLDEGTEYYFDSEQYEEIIIHYLEIGDITYADLATRYALKLHPTSLELKTKLLEVLLEQENYPKAYGIITELRQAQVNTTDFLVCCAKYYSNLGNPKRSLDYCRKAILLGDELAFIHTFMGDEYYNLGDTFQALKHYQIALKHDHQDQYAFESVIKCFQEINRRDKAEIFLNTYLDQYPFEDFAWVEYAQFYFNQKNFHEALKGFDYALAIRPDAPGVYSSRALCYEEMGEWAKAIEVYEELLELEYTKSYTYYRIGLCYKELNLPQIALTAFQKSLVEDPQFYLPMMEQSDIYYDMGDLEAALHFAKEAVSLNENSPEYLKKLAFLYLENLDFQHSMATLARLCELEPERFYNWYAHAEVAMILENFQLAIEIIDRALPHHNRAELLYQKANSLYYLHQEKLARQTLKMAMRLDIHLLKDMEEKYPCLTNDAKQIRVELEKN